MQAGWSLDAYRNLYAALVSGHIPPFEGALQASRQEAEDLYNLGVFERGARVLDTGCGHGRSALGLLELGIGGYTGLDVVVESIAFCKRAFGALPGFEFMHLDVKNEFYNPEGRESPQSVSFPVESAAFDAVIAGSLYTHLGTREVCERYLAESHRALKPGGRIFCSWFRSPPNQVSDDRLRSVLPESDILEMVSRRFHIYHCRGGGIDDTDDQWCLYGRKKES